MSVAVARRPILTLKRPPKTLIETKADVAAEIAPEHHQTPLMARTRGFADNFARDLIEATRDVPQEPKASRRLRLALAVTEIAPAVPVGVVLSALAAFRDGLPLEQRADAAELIKALHGTVNGCGPCGSPR